MKNVFSACVVGFCVLGLCAETIDLGATGDLSLTALDDAATYVNTGSELRTLTVTTTGACTNSCSILGGIRLVKGGSGFLALSGANTYTGGTLIQKGVLSAAHSSAFGTGTIEVGSTVQTSQVRFDVLDGVFANDIHVLASSETYPAIGLWNGSSVKSYGRGMTFTGAIAADGDLVFLDSGLWTDAYSGKSLPENRSYYYSGVFNGTVSAKGTIRLVAVCRHVFKGAVSAAKFSLNASSGVRNTNARGTVYLASDQNHVQTFELNYCWFEAKVANAYNGAVLDWKFSDDGQNGEDYRGYYRTGNLNQTIAGFGGVETPASRSAWTRYKVNGGGTWTVTGAVDRASDVFFDNSACSITVNAPGATHTFHQTFTHRAAQNTGALTVLAGTMKVTGVQSFQKATSVTVGANGTFLLESTTNQALKAVASLTVASGGAFTVGEASTDPLPNSALVVRLGASSVLTLPEGMNVDVAELYVDGVRMTGGVYGGTTGRSLPQLVGGTLNVAPYVADVTTATWTDATGDHALETGANWTPADPDLTEGSLLATIQPQTSTATISQALTFRGMVFDLPDSLASLTLARATTSAQVSISTNGVQFLEAANGVNRTVTIEPNVCFMGSQSWNLDGRTRSLSLANGYSSSYGYPRVVFSSTNLFALETGDASGFAGQIFTTNACVRPKSGVAPFGGSQPEIYLGPIFGNATNQAALATSGDGNVFSTPVRVTVGSSAWTIPFCAGPGTSNVFQNTFSTYSAGLSSSGGRVNRSVRYYFATNSYTRFEKAIGSDWTPMAYDGPGEVEFMSVLSSGSHVYIGYGAPTTARFHAARNQGYCFIISAKARAIVDVDNAFKPSAEDARNVQVDGTMEMGSTAQRLWGLVGSGRIVGTEGGTVKLYGVHTNVEDFVRNPLVTNSIKFDGAIDVMQGSGRFTLKGVSQTTGSLSVTNGLLTLDTMASWTNAASVTVSGKGRLALARDGQFNGDAVVVNLADEGEIAIPTGVRIHVAELYLDRSEKKARPGTYGGLGSGATHTDARFTGGGFLLVNGSGFCVIFR